MIRLVSNAPDRIRETACPASRFGHRAVRIQNPILRKRQIKDVCMKRKTWDTISFVIPFPRSSFLLPDIQIFGYSL